ncbi:hypothetical protein FSP39_002772 [Pinctada imbricata]|uniref:V(D)J recombination-activating protein 1 n=1 Tax=Pinctada imbricata TaxID=66713 RepID=A0AA88XWR7_PINIB|nr:hypothetical protein FSP39_002772 [Pinctada imbricata]
MPTSCEFKVVDNDGHVLFEHSSVDDPSEPLSINECFLPNFVEFATPNCLGVRWPYPTAIARTLLEIESELDLLNADSSDTILHVVIKDGCDGMGDVSVYKEKDCKTLPDKAFRFSICIVKITAECNGKTHEIFKETSPNSVRTNRPLLESISDENNYASNIVSMLPIENERKLLTDNFLHLNTSKGWLIHKFSFFNSMVDEKRDRGYSGLQGSGSNYLCTLCDASRQSAKECLGTFTINRSIAECIQISEFLRVNPQNLSENELKKQSKGVKSHPMSKMEPIQKGIDATHADINLGQFFKKLIVREIASVTKWELTPDVKSIVQTAESSFDRHMKTHVGINPQLMMPGNYARTLFQTNHDISLALIPDSERRNNLSVILNIFCKLRSVYRAKDPLVECPSEVASYKQTAIQMGSLLMEHFHYAQWPNYLHKVIEHVQQLIEDPKGPGSIGSFSSEGNEAGNKLFRHFRKNLSRRGNTYGSLCDVLKLHWLYSSKALCKIAEIEHKRNKCSLCFTEGHNKRKCPLLNSSV